MTSVHRRLEKVEEILSVGDTVKVKVIEVNPDGKVRLSAKALIERPEGQEDDDRGGGRGPRHQRSRR